MALYTVEPATGDISGIDNYDYHGCGAGGGGGGGGGGDSCGSGNTNGDNGDGDINSVPTKKFLLGLTSVLSCETDVISDIVCGKCVAEEIGIGGVYAVRLTAPESELSNIVSHSLITSTCFSEGIAVGMGISERISIDRIVFAPWPASRVILGNRSIEGIRGLVGREQESTAVTGAKCAAEAFLQAVVAAVARRLFVFSAVEKTTFIHSSITHK